jgi:hypothetical protein
LVVGAGVGKVDVVDWIGVEGNSEGGGVGADWIDASVGNVVVGGVRETVVAGVGRMTGAFATGGGANGITRGDGDAERTSATSKPTYVGNASVWIGVFDLN